MSCVGTVVCVVRDSVKFGALIGGDRSSDSSCCLLSSRRRLRMRWIPDCTTSAESEVEESGQQIYRMSKRIHLFLIRSYGIRRRVLAQLMLAWVEGRGIGRC